ncbi:MAG TPA: hypothetical protein VFB84_14500 [Micromonosporaceae bacterium]|nr:hypothetical protein [Micromonosporaceae bacterium]
MSTQVSVVRENGGYRWMVVRFLPNGADVLARSVAAYPDEASCRAAAGGLRLASPYAMTSVQQEDGGWRWTLTGEQGEPLAESAVTFHDARTCGEALTGMQAAMQQLAQGSHPDLAATAG